MIENIYILPSQSGDYVYAPLSRFIEKVGSNDIEIPAPLFSVSNKDNYEYRWAHLIVIPTQICNLGCSYCYAKLAHSRKVIDKETLKVGYDFLLSQEQRSKSISFIGGGEPVVAWDILRWSLEYIEGRKDAQDNICYYLTTNATLLDISKVTFLHQYNVNIELSFDILRDIQDSQRPFANSKRSSYKSVLSSVSLLEHSNYNFSIRATITPQSVGLMPKMIESLADFKNVKKVKLEPVTGFSLGKNFYFDYTNSFWKAREVGRRIGIEVTNSIVSSVKNIREQFCTGEFCITPDGIISACHRNSSDIDEMFSASHVGNICNHVDISYEKMTKFLQIASIPTRCNSCFARWHCAGFCPMEWKGISNEETLQKCNFIRENVRRTIFEIYNIDAAESEKP